MISVVHDLSLARAFGTHALLLDRGRVIAQGAAAEVFTRDNLHKTYSMDIYGWMQYLLEQWR